MAFKLGKETRRIRSSNNTPIFRKKLDGGIIGEANMDGSIYISEDVEPGSDLEKRAIAHEGEHINQMEKGDAHYTDNHVYWKGQKFERRNGRIKYMGKWYREGTSYKDDEIFGGFPWENEAVKAENNV
tara:strand:+ start:404 stop:787 length:384 start_codon:yes stop_codon:yes gene_type:complete